VILVRIHLAFGICMTLLQFRLSAFCQCHIPQHHYLISLQFIAYTWIYFWLYYNYLLSYIWIYLNCNGSIGTVACIVATIRLYSTYYPVHTLLTDRYVPLLLPLSDTFCTPIYSIVLGLFGRALTFSTSKHSARFPGSHWSDFLLSAVRTARIFLKTFFFRRLMIIDQDP
jgi:hypothetical protein